MTISRMFATVPDDRLREMMEMHFGIITGLTSPTPKGKGASIEEWKNEFSFINVMAFVNAFDMANERGMCSPIEIAQGNEIKKAFGY